MPRSIFGKALIWIAVSATVVLATPVLALWLILRMHYVPPLLNGVKAAGGWLDACPPRSDQEKWARGSMPLALSKELDANLLEQFPPGSPAITLQEALVSQKFTLDASCKADETIHKAHFGPNGNDWFASALIYWKVNDNGSIAWTKGLVFIRAL